MNEDQAVEIAAAQDGTLRTLDAICTYMEEESNRLKLVANKAAVAGNPGEMLAALDDSGKCLKHRYTLLLLRYAIVRHGYTQVMRFLEG